MQSWFSNSLGHICPRSIHQHLLTFVNHNSKNHLVFEVIFVVVSRINRTDNFKTHWNKIQNALLSLSTRIWFFVSLQLPWLPKCNPKNWSEDSSFIWSTSVGIPKWFLVPTVWWKNPQRFSLTRKENLNALRTKGWKYNPFQVIWSIVMNGSNFYGCPWVISDANILMKNSTILFSNLRVVFDLKGYFEWNKNNGIFVICIPATFYNSCCFEWKVGRNNLRHKGSKVPESFFSFISIRYTNAFGVPFVGSD